MMVAQVLAMSRWRCGSSVIASRGRDRPGAADTLALERHEFRRAGATIHYQVAGAGAPVVLIHGLSGSGRWWVRNLPALARQFRVYVIDLIGFGNSRAGPGFVLREAAACLADWLDGLGIGRARLVGHSMGGFIAADLAADQPSRVERLVLVSAAGLPFERSRLGHALALGRGLYGLQPDFLPVLASDAYRAGPLTIMKAARELLSTDIRPKLCHVQAPTLLVWGERDSVVPLSLGQQLTRYLPRAQLAVIAGAGHVPMWDRPAEFNRLVLDFLDSPSRAAISSVA